MTRVARGHWGQHVLEMCFSNFLFNHPFSLSTHGYWPPCLMQHTQGSIFKRLLFKEIDTYHDPQLNVMDVLGGLHKASKYWETINEVQPLVTLLPDQQVVSFLWEHSCCSAPLSPLCFFTPCSLNSPTWGLFHPLKNHCSKTTCVYASELHCVKKQSGRWR